MWRRNVNDRWRCVAILIVVVSITEPLDYTSHARSLSLSLICVPHRPLLAVMSRVQNSWLAARIVSVLMIMKLHSTSNSTRAICSQLRKGISLSKSTVLISNTVVSQTCWLWGYVIPASVCLSVCHCLLATSRKTNSICMKILSEMYVSFDKEGSRVKFGSDSDTDHIRLGLRCPRALL